MTQTHSTTSGRKSKHLSFKERSQIELLKEQGHSNRAIARILKRAPQTIHNEIKRGTFKQIRQQKQNGKIYKWYYSKSVSYTHLTLPTILRSCRSRWSPYH